MLIMNNRTSRILLAAGTALHLSFIAFNNLTDYNSNLFFVQGVFSMEDTFSYPVNSWRAVQSPALIHVGYWSIILTEMIAALCLWIGLVRMILNRTFTTEQFSPGNAWVIRGLMLALLLWFFGFVIVGGEWFLMWQSEKFNAQPTAFQLAIFYLLLLMYYSRPIADADESRR